MNEQDLLDAGYKGYPEKKYTQYQKHFDDKFYINVYVYDLGLGLHIEAAVQFTRGKEVFNIELLRPQSVTHIERFHLNAWNCLKADGL